MKMVFKTACPIYENTAEDKTCLQKRLKQKGHQ